MGLKKKIQRWFSNQSSRPRINEDRCTTDDSTNPFVRIIKRCNEAATNDDNEDMKNVEPLKRSPLDDFHFEGEISSGSFGQVLLATDASSSERYAVKILTKSPETEEELRNEVHVLLSVTNHPYFVQLQLMVETHDSASLVMNFVTGGSLYDAMDDHLEGLPRHDVVLYTAQLVCAIHYLHKLRIIHRDVKPGNILLHENGHVVLTDFGSSKPEMEPSPFKSNDTCGTLVYMAPEMVTAEGHSFPVDWWSLGVVVYEMVTRKLPFRGPLMRVSDYIVNQPVRMPRGSFQSDCDLINGLLHKDPDQRMGSNLEVLKAEPFFGDFDWSILDEDWRETKTMFMVEKMENGLPTHSKLDIRQHHRMEIGCVS